MHKCNKFVKLLERVREGERGIEREERERGREREGGERQKEWHMFTAKAERGRERN